MISLAIDVRRLRPHVHPANQHARVADTCSFSIGKSLFCTAHRSSSVRVHPAHRSSSVRGASHTQELFSARCIPHRRLYLPRCTVRIRYSVRQFSLTFIVFISSAQLLILSNSFSPSCFPFLVPRSFRFPSIPHPFFLSSYLPSFSFVLFLRSFLYFLQRHVTPSSPYLPFTSIYFHLNLPQVLLIHLNTILTFVSLIFIFPSIPPIFPFSPLPTLLLSLLFCPHFDSLTISYK